MADADTARLCMQIVQSHFGLIAAVSKRSELLEHN